MLNQCSFNVFNPRAVLARHSKDAQQILQLDSWEARDCPIRPSVPGTTCTQKKTLLKCNTALRPQEDFKYKILSNIVVA